MQLSKMDTHQVHQMLVSGTKFSQKGMYFGFSNIDFLNQLYLYSMNRRIFEMRLKKVTFSVTFLKDCEKHAKVFTGLPS